MIESGATPQAIAKVMVQQEILNAIGKSPDDMAKGQLISECLFDVQKTNKKFDKFLPENLKSGQIIK